MKLNRLCRKYELERLIAQVVYETRLDHRLKHLLPSENNDSEQHESRADLDNSDRKDQS